MLRTGCPARARPPSAEGQRRARLGGQRLAADRLRLRQDLHLLHRPVQPRSRAKPSVRRDRRRGAQPRRGRLPRGDPARPERQLVRPRPAGRAALRPHRHRALGRSPARSGGPARPGRADPGDRRDPDRRRRPGHPAASIRDVAPVGPVRPADRRDGRLPVGLRAPPPAGPVRRRRGPAPDGPPVHAWSTTSSGSRRSARRSRASRSRPT